MAEQSIQIAAHKMIYILVVEQSLRAGESMTANALTSDLQRHGISEEEQGAALALAISKGWLQQGADGEVHLTEAGFDMNFTQ